MKLRPLVALTIALPLATSLLVTIPANATPDSGLVRTPYVAVDDRDSIPSTAYANEYLWALSRFVRSAPNKGIRFAFKGKFDWEYFSEIGIPQDAPPGKATVVMNPDGSFTDVEEFAGLQRLLTCGPIKKSRQTCYTREPNSTTWYRDVSDIEITNNPQLDFLMGDFQGRQEMAIMAPGSNVLTYMTSQSKYPLAFRLVSNNAMFPDMVSEHVSVFTPNRYRTRGTYARRPAMNYSIAVTSTAKKKIEYPTGAQLGPKPPIPHIPDTVDPTPEPSAE